METHRSVRYIKSLGATLRASKSSFGYFSENPYGIQSSGSSTVDCTGGIERYVWAGDNVLWELRGPGANSETPERLE